MSENNQEAPQSEAVTFSAVSEPWTEIVTAEGVTIRMRTVVTEVRRLLDQKDANGIPIHQISAMNVFAPAVQGRAGKRQ